MKNKKTKPKGGDKPAKTNGEDESTHRKHGAGTLELHGTKWRAVWRVDGVTFKRSTGTADRTAAENMLEAWTAPYRMKQNADADAKEAKKARRAGRGIAAAAVAERGREARIAVGREAVPLEAAWEKFSRRRDTVGDSTARTDEYRWNAFLEWMKHNRPTTRALADVTRETAEDFLEEIKAKHSAKTHNEYRALLAHVWNELDDAAGLDGANPWRRVKAIKGARMKSHSRRELTVEELAAVYAETEGEMRTLFAIGIYTGLRLGDAVRLDWGAVDLVRGFISVVPSKTEEHGTRVKIAISDVLRGLLEATPPRRRRGPVLPELAAEYGDGEGSMKVVRKVQAVFRAAGIETQSATNRKNNDGTARKAVDVGFHSLRHTYVSLCANAGVPLATVQKIVGHTNVAMTEHYFHVSDDSLREVNAALPDVTGAPALPAPANPRAAIETFREACEALAAAELTAADWREVARILAAVEKKRRA